MPKGQYPRTPGLKRNRSSRPLEDRFWVKVSKSEDCWLWIGGRSTAGYGTFNLGRRGAGYDFAHRVAYRLLVGPIPDGLELDHLCRNRACVNPAHLEPVPHQINVARGAAASAMPYGRCEQGHELTEANVYRRKDRPGAWNCRQCRRERRVASLTRSTDERETISG